ncbi:MAG: MFS transporter [Microbacterium sp.]
MTGTKADGRAFELWMVSNFAAGAGIGAFVTLLVAPYVTGATGSAADAGIVVSVISIAAVLGPVFGGLADRYRAHRLVLSGGVLAMAMAFAMFAISSGDNQLYALDAIVLGAAIAAQQAVAPAFVVAAGLPKPLEARRLTALSLLFPTGQVVGAALLAFAASAGWTYPDQFWLASAFTAVAGLITVFTSRAAAARISAGDRSVGQQKSSKAGLRGVFASVFGVYLLVLVLTSVTSNGINNQIANILPNVYGMSTATTSAMVSLAGLINIPLFFAAGALMTRTTSTKVFFLGVLLRSGGALLLALLGLISGSPLLLVAASVQLLYQGTPFVRLAQPAVAVKFATIAPTEATGWVIGASAIGSFIGSLLGGYLGEELGFNAINWMGAIAGGIAIVLIATVLLRRDRHGTRPPQPSARPMPDPRSVRGRVEPDEGVPEQPSEGGWHQARIPSHSANPGRNEPQRAQGQHGRPERKDHC